jgi:ABC-type transporter Mla MlaB component
MSKIKKSERLVKTVIYLGKTPRSSLRRLEERYGDEDLLCYPIRDLIHTAHPKAPWLRFLDSKLNLKLSIHDLENAVYFATPLPEDPVRAAYVKSQARIIANIYWDEVGGRTGTRIVRSYTPFYKTHNVLSMLKLRTEAQIRDYIRGVFYTKARFNPLNYIPTKSIHGIYSVLGYIEYLVKTDYARYGENETTRSHVKTDLDYIQRLSSASLALLSSVINDGRAIGKGRKAIELSLVDDSFESAWIALGNKYVLELYDSRELKKIDSGLCSKIGSLSWYIPTDVFVRFKSECDKMWEGIPENSEWDKDIIDGLNDQR